MIYHYCSLETALKIFETKSLWASDYRYLNDYNEVTEAMVIFDDFVESLSDLNLIAYNKIRSQINNTLMPLLKNIQSRKKILHLCCFSKKPDILSQWRGYADGGNGLAIGFDPEVLRRKGLNIVDVCYDSKDFDKELEKLIIDASDKIVTKAFNDEVFGLELLSLISSYKNKAFCEEAESRIVLMDDTQYTTKYRLSGNMVCPYLVVDLNDFWEELIPEVYLGPGNVEGTLNASSIIDFFRKSDYGLQDVRIHFSKASLRT